MTRPATPWSATALARPTGSATASPSSWWRRPRLPAPCASSFCPRAALENRAATRGTNSASTGRAASNGKSDDARHDDERFGKSLGRAHDQAGTRPVVPRQRTARRRDADADRPLRGEAEGAARAPPPQPQIHAGQVRVPGRAHRAARPRHAGGERIAFRHPEKAAGARAKPRRCVRARHRAGGGARDGRGNRPAAWHPARPAAFGAGRYLGRLRQGARAPRPRADPFNPVSYTHLRAHETVLDLVCRLLLEKK